VRPRDRQIQRRPTRLTWPSLIPLGRITIRFPTAESGALPALTPSPSADLPAALPFPPACLSCGACCFSTAAKYVPVTGDDYARLGADSERWVTWQNNRAFMNMTDGHCAALSIESNEFGLQFVCQIYKRRPQTCRDLARGSPQCEADWEQKAELAQVVAGKSGACTSGMLAAVFHPCHTPPVVAPFFGLRLSP
jgi:uncharacterized protein